MMENLLIIGGSYFAGRVFIEKLLERREYNIFVFNRGNVPLNFEGVTELVGDREQPEMVRDSIPSLKWRAVIDFCGYAPEQMRSLVENLTGAVDQYIFVSTTSVYAHTIDLPVKEASGKVLAPQPELGPYATYGYDKWRSEVELVALSNAKGFPYTILRPAIIYGRYNYAPRESYFFDLIEKNSTIVIPESGLPLFSFLLVDDLASVILKCLNNDRTFGEAFNICGPELISYQRLVVIFEELSGRRFEVEKLPPSEIDRRGIPLPFPLDQHLIYSYDKLRDAIDFKFTPFVEGVRKTWQFYKWQKSRGRV